MDVSQELIKVFTPSLCNFVDNDLWTECDPLESDTRGGPPPPPIDATVDL